MVPYPFDLSRSDLLKVIKIRRTERKIYDWQNKIPRTEVYHERKRAYMSLRCNFPVKTQTDGNDEANQ